MAGASPPPSVSYLYNAHRSHRTCNASRTAQTPTRATTSFTSNPCGKPSRCSVSSVLSPNLVRTSSYKTPRASRRNALYVSSPSSCPPVLASHLVFLLLSHPPRPPSPCPCASYVPSFATLLARTPSKPTRRYLKGFLPVLFTWLNSKRQSASAIHLSHDQSDTQDDQEEEPSSSNVKGFPDSGPQPLQGWKYLLLWLPAACDLTGTTVRPNSSFSYSVVTPRHYSASRV